MYLNEFFQQIFSIENKNSHKILTIFGFKIPIKSKVLELKNKIIGTQNACKCLGLKLQNIDNLIATINEKNNILIDKTVAINDYLNNKINELTNEITKINNDANIKIDTLTNEFSTANTDMNDKIDAFRGNISDLNIQALKKSQYDLIGDKVRQKMGKNSYACEYFTVASEETTIGAFCSIANNVSIGTTHHPINFLSTHPFCYFEPSKLDKDSKQLHFEYVTPCHIGNDVWIGKGAVIMDGITIGHGAIIGTGAIVTHDVPPYAIVAGVPAKILRYRFNKKIIDKLLELKWWELDDKQIAQLPFDNIDECIKRIQNIRSKTCI